MEAGGGLAAPIRRSSSSVRLHTPLERVCVTAASPDTPRIQASQVIWSATTNGSATITSYVITAYKARIAQAANHRVLSRASLQLLGALVDRRLARWRAWRLVTVIGSIKLCARRHWMSTVPGCLELDGCHASAVKTR